MLWHMDTLCPVGFWAISRILVAIPTLLSYMKQCNSVANQDQVRNVTWLAVELESYWSLVLHTGKIMNSFDNAYNKQNLIEIVALIMKDMDNPLDEILFKLFNTCSAWRLCMRIYIIIETSYHKKYSVWLTLMDKWIL